MSEAVVQRLRAGYRAEPRGIPVRDTILSWSIGEGSTPPHIYRVTVRSGDAVVHEVETDRLFALVPGSALAARRVYTWTVEAPTGQAASSFETGVDPSQWAGSSWTSAEPLSAPRESYDPVILLRKAFSAGEFLGRPRIYATALGLYRIWLNDVEITEDALLRPGWTDYRKRVHHQTYDVAKLLKPDENVIAVALAKGWYAGRLGLLRKPAFYGNHPWLRVMLDDVADDGSARHVVVSDQTWQAHRSSILASDLLRGETVDYRLEPQGWRLEGFDDATWAAATVDEEREVRVDPQPHDHIRVWGEFPGKMVREHGRGPIVFDFGQNIVGWTRLQTELIPDTEVIVRHGEILTPENLVYRDNLRGAFQEDRYSDAADAPRRLETSFTAHGFRYAEVWGLPNDDPYAMTKLQADTTVTAVAIDAGMEEVGSFQCSDPELTQLASNIAWTVRDNFLEVVTDCPQRDERHGWLGDAGVIAPTASYFFDTAAFLGKFAQDAADSQGSDGEIRNYAPAIPPSAFNPGAPGWADGYVRILDQLVGRYGDVATAERHFSSLLDFLAHVDRHNPDGLRVNAVGADFGDWLSLPERDGEVYTGGYEWTGAFSTSPRPVVGTAHTYRSFVEAAEIADRLGRDVEARRLSARAEQVRQAYLDAFVLPDGEIRGATQTTYAQAVGFGLLRDDDAQIAADRLGELIERRGYVTTGIHGVQHVLPTLARHGHADLAVELLLRREMPSWLYMVAKGATTIWEKWDGIRPDGTLPTAEMNSFNHCALGAVGAFLFEDLVGLRVERAIWDLKVEIAPLYTRRLDSASARYASPVGNFESAWSWAGEEIVHDIVIPASATASVRVPAGMQVRDANGAGPASGDAVLLTSGCNRLVVGMHS